MKRRSVEIAAVLLLAAALVPALFARTRRKVTGSAIEHNDACRLWPSAPVARAVGAPVNIPLLEPSHAVFITDGRVIQTLSACTYTIRSVAGKPARVRLEVRAFRSRSMLDVTWRYSGESPRFQNARRVANLGEEAWQGQALRLRKDNYQLTIEVDDASPWSSEGSDVATRSYAEIEIALARVALARLWRPAAQSPAAKRRH